MFAGASFMAAYLLFHKKVFAYALLALGVPMLAARVLSGIHYPGDVLFGFFLGVVLVKLLMPHVNSHRLRSSAVYAFPLRVAAFLKL
jgi:membrane-associated phospholipid phosphatase